jgi:hypothetical protein
MIKLKFTSNLSDIVNDFGQNDETLLHVHFLLEKSFISINYIEINNNNISLTTKSYYI